MAHDTVTRNSVPASMEGESTGTSAATAMTAIARLFAQYSEGGLGREVINPREVLFGLSVFFKAIAMSSEPDSNADIELGIHDLMDAKLPGITTLTVKLILS